jgi:hypothetical protein
LTTGRVPPPRGDAAALSADARSQEAEQLFAQLLTKHDQGEAARIGAAYRLASIGDTAVAVDYLNRGLHVERENVRRAATYGLTAVGPAATETLLAAAASPVKWIRKAGVFGLGEVAPLTDDVLAAVTTRLRDDPSVYVRSVAAGSLGCLGRRAVGTGIGLERVPACLEALAGSLDREENRLAMDVAQGRSIKMVRPTDDSDVCEGQPARHSHEQIEPVRSAVRENVLWSMVILCSHGRTAVGTALDTTATALETVIREDANLISIGLAMDALNRLANLVPHDDVSQWRERLPETLRGAPLLSWETLCRGGLSVDACRAIEQVRSGQHGG